MDGLLTRQIAEFQFSRSLPITGVLDKATVTHLRVPAAKLLRRLQIGLVRWQLSAARHQRTYVRVAIARLEVQLVRDGQVEVRLPAVVGRPSKQTPRFDGRITHIEVHPWWWGVGNTRRAVPPGPRNPLGQLALKTEPRHHLIYLHGTNAPRLFSKPYRMFSRGCIRLQDPVPLARILLDRDPGTETGADLDRLLARDRKTAKIYFRRPTHVFFEYNTTFVSPVSGHVHFVRDRYRDDRRFPYRVKLPEDPLASWQRSGDIDLEPPGQETPTNDVVTP